MALVEQIAVLLALAAGLFDGIPLEQMPDAERALCTAAADIPADTAARFTSGEKLSDGDRQATLDVATKALASFRKAPT